MSKVYKKEVEIFVSIQKLIDLLVKSVLEKLFFEQPLARLETLLKQELSNLVSMSKLFPLKM